MTLPPRPTDVLADERPTQRFEPLAHLIVRGALRVEGAIAAAIDADELHVTAQGHLSGPVNAGVVIVEGRLEGPVRALRAVEIRSGGAVVGDLVTPSLLLDRDGRLEGSCRITTALPVEASLDDDALSPEPGD
ncbi:MAG: polymer-forming cytoskeletal protein [Deltaproteobacteria bacterium]|nr:polymer-forming cytoskeletal protein [Deltaproteobacteria bacterium]